MTKKSVVPTLFRRWSFILAMLILVFAGYLKWNSSLMPDHVNIPTQVTPRPNAREAYTAAEAMLVDAVAADCANSNTLVAASSEANEKLSSWIPTKRLLTLAEKDRVLAENAGAFAKLHQAMKYPYPMSQDRSFAALFPYFSKDRQMARILSLQGQVRAQHGDWDGAIESYLDAMKIGGDVAHDGTLIGSLVGFACQAIGRRHCQSVIAHLSTDIARQAAHRLEAIDDSLPSPDRMLQMEEWFTQGSLLDLFRRKNWRRQFMYLMSSDNQDSSSNLSPGFLLAKFWLDIESPREVYRIYSGYMDEEVSIARLSWPAQKTARQPKLPTDPMCRVLVPAYAVVLKDRNAVALDRLLATDLALQAYKGEHGAYPPALSDLVPNELSHVPQDPFFDHQPLKYRRTGDKYLLYSIGQDAKDDGGMPIVNTDLKPPTYAVGRGQDQKGDIVAGINY